MRTSFHTLKNYICIWICLLFFLVFTCRTPMCTCSPSFVSSYFWLSLVLVLSFRSIKKMWKKIIHHFAFFFLARFSLFLFVSLFIVRLSRFSPSLSLGEFNSIVQRNELKVCVHKTLRIKKIPTPIDRNIRNLFFFFFIVSVIFS